MGSGNASDKGPSSDGNGDMPAWRWWTGLACYAVTNVGFLRLFDFCAGCTHLPRVLEAMAVYYGCAILLRLMMRRLLGFDKSFPQFWWEGIPSRGS